MMHVNYNHASFKPADLNMDASTHGCMRNSIDARHIPHSKLLSHTSCALECVDAIPIMHSALQRLSPSAGGHLNTVPGHGEREIKTECVCVSHGGAAPFTDIRERERGRGRGREPPPSRTPRCVHGRASLHAPHHSLVVMYTHTHTHAHTCTHGRASLHAPHRSLVVTAAAEPALGQRPE